MSKIKEFLRWALYIAKIAVALSLLFFIFLLFEGCGFIIGRLRNFTET